MASELLFYQYRELARPLAVTDSPEKPRIQGVVRSRDSLSESEWSALYLLFAEFYDGTNPERFRKDLEDKDWVVLLHEGKELRGFSTMKEYLVDFLDETMLIFFSGDTIIHPLYWGSPELSRRWTRHMFARKKAHPGKRAFWFLISSGQKTYRLLPLFFKDFFPRYGGTQDPLLPPLLAAIARSRFAEAYQKSTNVIQLQNPTPLKPGVAEVSDRELRNPHVRYFLENNPGFASGEELACIGELRAENLTAAGLRMLGESRLGAGLRPMTE